MSGKSPRDRCLMDGKGTPYGDSVTSSVSGNAVFRPGFRILVMSCDVWSADVHRRTSLWGAVVTQLVTQPTLPRPPTDVTATPLRRPSRLTRQIRPTDFRPADPSGSGPHRVPNHACRLAVAPAVVWPGHCLRAVGRVSFSETARPSRGASAVWTLKRQLRCGLLTTSMRTTGGHEDLIIPTACKGCLWSCMPAVVCPCCCTFCCTRLTSKPQSS